ncbi:hypothetical protein, partial [Mesorhizobium sp. M2C.T.Ca.TU.002.02.1.1]|uniref:hypothetical protein n=1 Tax=Mesorhizobium sp. M2C.T.Ca.TU.002.02.1.1 TaxID=2496788 RepID=UPI0019D244BD
MAQAVSEPNANTIKAKMPAALAGDAGLGGAVCASFTTCDPALTGVAAGVASSPGPGEADSPAADGAADISNA